MSDGVVLDWDFWDASGDVDVVESGFRVSGVEEEEEGGAEEEESEGGVEEGAVGGAVCGSYCC